MAGYSGTPLIKKLGIKAGFRILLVNAPKNYMETLGPLPENVTLVTSIEPPIHLIQIFTKSHAELAEQFLPLMKPLSPDGMLWVSWPKKASKVPTDLTEAVIRQLGLEAGLVDVKVCAVDEIWSGLKFVYRVKDRPS